MFSTTNLCLSVGQWRHSARRDLLKNLSLLSPFTLALKCPLSIYVLILDSQWHSKYLYLCGMRLSAVAVTPFLFDFELGDSFYWNVRSLLFPGGILTTLEIQLRDFSPSGSLSWSSQKGWILPRWGLTRPLSEHFIARPVVPDFSVCLLTPWKLLWGRKDLCPLMSASPMFVMLEQLTTFHIYIVLFIKSLCHTGNVTGQKTEEAGRWLVNLLKKLWKLSIS